ncbi:hypothetical protein MPLB_1510027 [Mesorhizobium sp. ORS 3324]|nr:hypothetical protein MPLB_1510027 [Mesorhizobium sp. ORS 3324]
MRTHTEISLRITSFPPYIGEGLMPADFSFAPSFARVAQAALSPATHLLFASDQSNNAVLIQLPGARAIP